MSGLLDFALGFGSGAAGAYAQTKQMEIANRAEETRMKNIERLKTQYRREEIRLETDEKIRAAQAAAESEPETFETVNYMMPGGTVPITVDASDIETQKRLIAQKAYRVSESRGPLVSNVIGGDDFNPFEEGVLKDDAERAQLIDQQADVARTTLPIIEQMEAALESGKFETGFLANIRLTAGEAARLFNIKLPEDLKAGDPATGSLLRSGFSNLAIETAQGMSRQTNLGLKMISESLGSLETTPEGNQIILETMRRLAQRRIQIADLKDEYTTYGTLSMPSLLPEGVPTFNRALTQLDEENPIMTEEMIERIENLTTPGREVSAFDLVPARTPQTGDQRFDALISITSQEEFNNMLNQMPVADISARISANPEIINSLTEWQKRALANRIRRGN